MDDTAKRMLAYVRNRQEVVRRELEAKQSEFAAITCLASDLQSIADDEERKAKRNEQGTP